MIGNLSVMFEQGHSYVSLQLRWRENKNHASKMRLENVLCEIFAISMYTKYFKRSLHKQKPIKSNIYGHGGLCLSVKNDSSKVKIID